MTNALFVNALPLHTLSSQHRLRSTSICARRTMATKQNPQQDEPSSRPMAAIAAPAPPSSPTPTPLENIARPSQDTEGNVNFEPGIVHEIRTPDEFDHLQEECNHNNVLLVADFMAKWCRKCKYLLPRFRKIAASNPNARFCTVDVNAVARLPRQFSIAKMPTFIFLKDGEVIHTLVGGAAPETVAAQLLELVNKAI